MAKIFISYDRASKDVIEQLVQDLTDDDVDVWFDQHLTGGQSWWNNILSEIRECEIFVAALTPDFLESKACQRELKYATDLQRILLPVRFSDRISADSLPSHLSELQWTDYSLRSVDAFRSLQRALRRLPKAARLPDPLPDPPPVPLSYLSSLRSRIDSDSQLQLQEQIQLVSDLKQQSRKGALAKDMIDLLQRLRSRDDLFARVLQDIDDLIRDIGSVLPPEPAPKPPEDELSPPITPPEAPAADELAAPPEPPALDLTDTPRAPEVMPQTAGLPPPKTLLALAGFVIGAVILAAYFLFSPGDKSVPLQDSQKQASVAAPHEESNKSVTASPVVQAPSTAVQAPTSLVMAPSPVAKAQKPEIEIHARHILVATEKEAKTVLKRLMGGEEFATIAKQVSKDPGSGGGDLGWFTKDRMVPEFADAGFKLEVGQVSDPVKSADGWHIIEILGKRQKTFLPLDQSNFLAAPPQDAKPDVPASAVISIAPPAPGPAADEVAWSLIKDTGNVNLLRQFIRQFPNSPRRNEAEQSIDKIANLPVNNPQTNLIPPAAPAVASPPLQAEPKPAGRESHKSRRSSKSLAKTPKSASLEPTRIHAHTPARPARTHSNCFTFGVKRVCE